MTVRALRVVAEPNHARLEGTLVESGNDDVAGVAQFGDLLIGEHVPVHRAMRIGMARGTALDAIAQVLEDPGSLFVRVTLDAGLVLETAQLRAGALAVLIVAVGALHHALVDSMSLVEVGRRPNLIVALETRLLTGAIVQRIASRSELGWDQVRDLRRVTRVATLYAIAEVRGV